MLDLFPRTRRVVADPFPPAASPMGERIRGFDWARTGLGAAETWPPELRMAVRWILASAEPACLWWGEDRVTVLNDACAPLVGGAQVTGLGMPAPAAWREIWPEVAQDVERAFATGEGWTAGPLPLSVDRAGRHVEGYYRITATPIVDEGGDVAGLLCVFSDRTAEAIAARELRMLGELAAQPRTPRSIEHACDLAMRALATDPWDVPFSGVYVADADGRRATLQACTGIAAGHEFMPREVETSSFARYPLQAALATIATQVVTLPETPFGTMPTGPWSRAPQLAVVRSLGAAGQGRTALWVAALNPFRELDGDYRRFLEVAAAQVAAVLASAQAADEERRRLEAETLQEIAGDLASELDLQALVQKVTDAGVRLTGASFGAFFYNTVNEDGEAFQLFTLSGAPREAFERFGMPRNTAVFKPTFLGQGPVRVDDIQADARYGRSAPHHGMPKGHLPVRSYLAVPVISRNGEVFGGLFFGHPEVGVFDARAERNATGLAAQASVAMDNAKLFGQARREIERRTRMERELRDGERRYRGLVEALPAAVYTTDSDGRIVLYNQAAVAIWGREPDPQRDRFCAAHLLFTAEGARLYHDACPVARVLAGETVARDQEVVVERPDGSVSHVLASPAPIHDEQGRIVGAMNMLIDITGRKRAEAELAQTKDELATQVESLEALHSLALRLGGMTEETPAMEAILDTAVSAQGGCSGFIWLEDAESGELVVRASRGFEGRATHFSRVMPGRDGGGAGNAFAQRRRWVVADTENDPLFAPYRDAAAAAGFRAVHSTPIITRGGALLGVLSVHFARRHQPSLRDQQVADVCARHAADAIEALRSQQRLRQSERLYRAIGESIDYGVWTADAEGRNTYTSESFLKMIGLSQAEWGGFGWRTLVHPDDAPSLAERWNECVRTGHELDQEFRVRCVDGTWRSVLGRGVPVRDEDGAIVAWAGINLDIQRLKRVENDLREHDRRKDEFLATLAHELRNPLAPLRNGLEVLRLAGGNADMATKARGMMERQLAQMVRLVDDLLDVSRVSRGKIELRREKVELAQVLGNAIETSQPLLNERRHELVVRVPEESIVVDADTTRLAQVFWNLLNNAAKYTEPGGHIEIGVRAEDGKVAVSIRDDGIGIPPEMQGRVFDIFTQVDRALEKSQGGLGIGLSIAKRLVEMHGGTIRVKSEGHRKGSEFVVTLPAQRAAAARDQGSDTGQHRRPNGPSRRILVVDDNPDSATTLSIVLEMLGNDVRVAHDGEEAFAAAAEFRPDIILLDIGMPKLNGYGACEMIRAQPWGREPYIVALTGWAQAEDRNRSRAAGFDQHLVKPVEPSMLEQLIRTLPARTQAAS